jgi:transketolase
MSEPSTQQLSSIEQDIARLEDVGFLTSMLITLLGNYAQTGHFGGPLAYVPYVVTSHLLGPAAGGLRFDYRRPKHPYADKFMLAGGHNAPVTYALWMVMGEALTRQHAITKNECYRIDPTTSILSIDALGFRRGQGALAKLLSDAGLADDPLFQQAKLRGIKALSGHSETTDLTNDVNGGPSGIGVATAAGKAAFWDIVGAPLASPKIMAIEGEFAMTAGHAQELKTQAIAQRVGKRLRVLLSYNNAGIDDELIGSVIQEEFTDYDIGAQWSSYGWNVISVDNGNDYAQVAHGLARMEGWDESDRRPMLLLGRTIKGWWPAAVDGEIPGYGKQIVDHASHPYAFPQNGDYFQALAGTFESRYGVKFLDIDKGAISDERTRLTQFKHNVDIALSILDHNDLGSWLADRLVAIGDQVRDDLSLRNSGSVDPFDDPRLKVDQLPISPQSVTVTDMGGSKTSTVDIKLFEEAGNVRGARRAVSEIFKWSNYVTNNRFVAVAADLAESINIQKSALFGYFDPVTNPSGTVLKAGIQEAGNASTAIGLVGQTLSLDPNVHNGVWALSGTYGAFTPLMYLPARVWSQQNQDSPFRVGVLHILAGHSGPETAADARTHFGIFAPQVWKLFPRGQVVTLNFWDYNDVAPGYFAAANLAVRQPEIGVIVLEVARPDFAVADRSSFADSDPLAAAKGLYVIKDFDPDTPKHGYVLTQGASSTNNLLKVLPRLEASNINVKVIACISEELFQTQPQSYRDAVLPPGAKQDLMIISTGTQRILPITGLGHLTEEYSLFSDWDNQWLSGGTEEDVIAEAHLDEACISAAITKFAEEREQRLERQRQELAAIAN